MVYEKALSKCMSICSRYEKCTNDMEQKMYKWEVSLSDQQKIIKHLISEKYIDHHRFTKAFVNDKIKYNHWGKVKVRFHLKHKSIESDIINQSLLNFSDDVYECILKEEIAKKRKVTKANSDYELSNKIAKSLITKGFEPHLVFNLLKLDITK